MLLFAVPHLDPVLAAASSPGVTPGDVERAINEQYAEGAAPRDVGYVRIGPLDVLDAIVACPWSHAVQIAGAPLRLVVADEIEAALAAVDAALLDPRLPRRVVAAYLRANGFPLRGIERTDALANVAALSADGIAALAERLGGEEPDPDALDPVDVLLPCLGLRATLIEARACGGAAGCAGDENDALHARAARMQHAG